jgi:hypothetical protein
MNALPFDETTEGCHILELRITDFLGIRDLELKAGKLNTARGGNGAGKTSLMEAINTGITGHLPSEPVRIGSDKSSIYIKLEDVTIQRRITGRTSTLKVTGPDGEVSRPQAFLDKLYAASQLNPISVVFAKPADRKKMLLSAMNLQIPDEMLTKWLGDFAFDEAVAEIITEDALESLEGLRKHYYDLRTAANGTKTTKERALADVVSRIPVGYKPIGADVATEYESLGALERQQAEYVRLSDGVTAAAAIVAAKERRVAELEQALAEARGELAVAVKDATTAEANHAESCDKSAEIEAQKTKIESMKANVANDELCKSRDILKGEVKEATETWSKLDAVVTRLQTRALDELLATSTFPVEGLEIIGDAIHINGVPIEQRSTGEQIGIALQICRALCGDLKIICVDGIERLDTPALEAFLEQAKGDGYQYFVTERTDGELTVDVEGDPDGS